MSQRSDAEALIKSLHGARLSGNLTALCAHFSDTGRFEIAGASADKPISISADGLAAFRPWLAMMVKVFRFSNYSLELLLVEGTRIAANWHVDIHSKVTGITVRTELVDLVETRGGLIVAYKEFFVPR